MNTPAFCFHEDGKTFTIIMRFFLKYNYKRTSDYCFFKFLWRRVKGALVTCLLAHRSVVLSCSSVQLGSVRVHLFVADFDRLCEMRPSGKAEERKVIRTSGCKI